ncbi:MAG: 4Fe-4S dicluster domain-containing protein [Deltaproteobacteria bacterium]|nr:4Fe-4S dicluster domain-containing protein [Deltaproteobacteria bacterium]
MDRITLFIMAVLIFFLIRRLILKQIRRESGIADYALILIAGLPYLTGYLYTHGTLDHLEFFTNNMLLFHMISGEVMLISAAFLFWTIRLRPDKCTGCAACVNGCPTDTLTANDKEKIRIFEYSNYRCISCGTCVKCCPEEAAQFRHQMSILKLFQLKPREKRRVELVGCDVCGKPFIPEPQMEHLNGILNRKDIELSSICICERCKMRQVGNTIFKPLVGPTSSEETILDN